MFSGSGLNSDLLHRVAHRINFRQSAEFVSSNPFSCTDIRLIRSAGSFSKPLFSTACLLLVLIAFTSIIWLLSHKWDTVIRFIVSVPVLSEQMMPTEPNASTASRCLTRQFFVAIRLAVRARLTVTQAMRPSGTLETTTPIKNTMEFISG